MTPLRGAVPGWPSDTLLTTAATPEEARTVLQAESETSVLHAAGMRWVVVRRVGQVTFLVAWLWLAVALARSLVVGDDARMPPVPLLAGFIALVLTRLMPWAWLRADPSRESLPSTRIERLRLSVAALRGSVTTSPAAHWPAGSEAFALLATAAMAKEIDAPWLLDRARLPAAVGAQWLDVLTHCGWLTGGDASLGRWLSRPVMITDAGRERLEAERTRLKALARS